jgi:polar amino acid transport system ATP-binding protein
VITLENLHKRHAGRAILSGASATIAENETVAIVGASGGGKTTLLRCLVALDSFDEGAVSIAGFTLSPGASALPDRMLVGLRSTIGFVFQELHLFPHLTILENVALAPRVVRRQAAEAATERARALLDRVGLGERTAAYPHELSGGQKQRVAIVRALAQEPRVLLLDEPTSALDPATAEDVARTLSELTRGKVTVVMVTHHLALARTLADRILELSSGRLREMESP